MLTQTLMLMLALDDDISGGGFATIQKRVDTEHAHSKVLSAERDALADRVRALEARVVGLEEERAGLQGDVQTLPGGSVQSLRRRFRRSESCQNPLCP